MLTSFQEGNGSLIHFLIEVCSEASLLDSQELSSIVIENNTVNIKPCLIIIYVLQIFIKKGRLSLPFL
jgi:hypothetical protein